MATDYLHPSEIARLILGYLKDKKLKKSYATFLRECPDLQEYWKLLSTGTVPSTAVMGFTLSDMLNEFCSMKLAAFHQACRQRDPAHERAELNVHLVPGDHSTDPSQCRPTSRSSPPSKSSGDNGTPLQPSTVGVSQSSQDSLNAGHSSAGSSYSKDIASTTSGSTVQEGKIDPIAKLPQASDDVPELVDPLERLLEDTTLQEKLADSINRAMKDSSFLDELDEAIGGSDVVPEKGLEKSSAPETEIVKANINNVVALTTCDPNFEELLSLVEQDAPSILHPAGSNGDKTLDSVNNPSVRVSGVVQERSQSQAPEEGQESTLRCLTNKSSLYANDGVNSCVMDTIQVSHKTNALDGAETPHCLNGSLAKNVENVSLSSLMPPPATPVGCSRRSRLKRVPKKSVHKPKDIFFKNSSGKNLSNTELEDVLCRVPQISQNDKVDSISKSHINETGKPVSTVYLDHENRGSNVEDDKFSRIHVSGQNKEQHDLVEDDAAHLHHGKTMKQDESPSDNSSHDISRTSVSSNAIAACNNHDDTSDFVKGKTSSLSEPESTPISFATHPSSSHTFSTVSADASDNSKQVSTPEAVPASSASTICTMDENSLSVFSLIEKNIAEMHGETFIPRHLRDQPNAAELAAKSSPAFTAVTSTVTSVSFSASVPVTSSSAISSTVTTVHTSNFAQGLGMENSDVQGQVQEDENIGNHVTTLKRNHSPEKQVTSLPFSPSHCQEQQTHGDDNASVHSDQSDNDFENQLSTPGAILVKPIGPYPSMLQRNSYLVDQCLKDCLEKLVKDSAQTASVTNSTQQDSQSQRNGSNICASDNHNSDAVSVPTSAQQDDQRNGSESDYQDSGAVNRPNLKNNTQENERLINDLCSCEGNKGGVFHKPTSCFNSQENSYPLKEKNTQALKRKSSERKLSTITEGNCNNTKTSPFIICSKTLFEDEWNRKFQETSVTYECSSLPAVLPSMKRSSESPDSTYQSSMSKPAFRPLGTSKFLQPVSFVSNPSSSEFQGRKKVISVDCLHAPYIPAHCKKVPSRRITPVGVSPWTPSPLQVLSPSSPANLLIDIPLSPAVPGSPVLPSAAHTVPSSPLVHPVHAGPLSPTVTISHRKLFDSAQTCPSKDQRLSSLCFDKCAEQRTEPESSSSSLLIKGTNKRSSQSQSSTLDENMPLSPSKRKPRRVVPKMLSSHTSNSSRMENSHSSQITKTITFDDAKTVSSSSDLSNPSEAEAFRMLKSHLNTFTKPQPKQEITSSGQVLKNSPLSKCGCVSRSTCKHRKGKMRSPNVGKTGAPSVKTPAKSDKVRSKLDLSQIGDTKNITEVSGGREDSCQFTRNKSMNRNIDVESVSILLGDSTQKETASRCDFRAVGTMEFQTTGIKASNENADIQLGGQIIIDESDKENCVKEILTSSSPRKVQEEIVSTSPRKEASPRCSFINVAPCSSSPDKAGAVATESPAFVCLTFETHSPEKHQSSTTASTSDHGKTSCQASTKSFKEKLHQTKESDLHNKKTTEKQLLSCFEIYADSDQGKGADKSKVLSSLERDNLSLAEKQSSVVEEIEVECLVNEKNSHSSQQTSEVFLSQSVTAFNGKTVDDVEKESTLIESEFDISQKHDSSERREEHGPKTVMEVSAPYFPELSNTHDFFKGKFLGSRDSTKAPSLGKESNIDSPIAESSNQIHLQEKACQEMKDPACADLKSVSEQNSASLSQPLGVRPLSPDLMINGEISLLRQAMTECDIPHFSNESDVSKMDQCSDSIAGEPYMAPRTRSQTQRDSTLSNEVISSGTDERRNVTALKTSTVKQIQPVTNHLSAQTSFPGTPKPIQPKIVSGFTETTLNSRYTPICPKEIPKGSSIVYAQWCGEMVPFLIPPNGLPIMLPMPQTPILPPTPNTSVTTPLAVADVVPCTAVSSDKVNGQTALQTPTSSHPKKKALPSRRKKAAEEHTPQEQIGVHKKGRSHRKGHTDKVDDHRSLQSPSSSLSKRKVFSPKRIVKGQRSTVADKNYKPKQKIALRRKGFLNSTPTKQTSSYFKRGLRSRKASRKRATPDTPPAVPNNTELSESTCESICSDRNTDAEKVTVFAENTGHNGIAKIKAKSACITEVDAGHSPVTNLRQINLEKENETLEVTRGETSQTKHAKDKKKVQQERQKVSQHKEERGSERIRVCTSSNDSKDQKVKSGKVNERENSGQSVPPIHKEAGNSVINERSGGEAGHEISSGNHDGTKIQVEATEDSGSEQLGVSKLSKKPNLSDAKRQLDEGEEKESDTLIDNRTKKQGDHALEPEDISGLEGLSFLPSEIFDLDYRSNQPDGSVEKLKGTLIRSKKKQNVDKKTKRKGLNTNSGQSSNDSGNRNAEAERVSDLKKDKENKQKEVGKSVISLNNQTVGEKPGVETKYNNGKVQEVPCEKGSRKAVDHANNSSSKVKTVGDVENEAAVSLQKSNRKLNSSLKMRKKVSDGLQRNDLLGGENESNIKSDSCHRLDIANDGKELRKNERKASSQEGERNNLFLDNSLEERMAIGSDSLPAGSVSSVETKSNREEPGEMKESRISPFSVKKDKISGERQGRRLSNIFDIVKNVYTGLEKNKLKALSKEEGTENYENTARRRSLRSTVISDCKDYYEHSEEEDEDEENSDEIISNSSDCEESQQESHMSVVKEDKKHGPANQEERHFSHRTQNLDIQSIEGRGKRTHNSRSDERRKRTPGSQERRNSTPGSQERRNSTPGSQERRKSTPRSLERRSSTPGSQERRKGTPRSQDRKKSTPGSQERRKGTSGSLERRSSTPGSQERRKGTPGSQERRKGTSGSLERRKHTHGSPEMENYSPTSQRNTEEMTPTLSNTNAGRKTKIISRQRVSIKNFNLSDEIITLSLLKVNPFPIYEPQVKSQDVSVSTIPKTSRSKLRLRKAETGAAKKTRRKAVKAVTGTSVEIHNDRGNSPPSDPYSSNEVHSVDQEELDRAVLALQQADDTFRTQLDWVSRGFESEKRYSPLKNETPALISPAEDIAVNIMSSRSISKTTCNSEEPLLEPSARVAEVESMVQFHLHETSEKGAVKDSGDSADMLLRKGGGKPDKRKRKASSPDANTCTEYSLKSYEKRKKQRKDKHQEAFRRDTVKEKVASVEFIQPSVNNELVGSTAGSMSSSNGSKALSINNSYRLTSEFGHGDCAMTTLPQSSKGASYLFSITETELNDMNQKAMENRSESNDRLNQNDEEEALLGGLELLSTVAVDTGLAFELSQSHYGKIHSTLSKRLTRHPSDSMGTNEGNDETAVMVPSTEVDFDKNRESSESTLPSRSASSSSHHPSRSANSSSHHPSRSANSSSHHKGISSDLSKKLTHHSDGMVTTKASEGTTVMIPHAKVDIDKNGESSESILPSRSTSSPSNHEGINPDLSKSLTQHHSDDIVTSKASDETTVVFPSAKGDIDKESESSMSTLPWMSARLSSSHHTPALASQSSQSLDQSFISASQKSDTESITFSSSESISASQSMQFSSSQGKSISPAAMKRLLKKLYKGKKS